MNRELRLWILIFFDAQSFELSHLDLAGHVGNLAAGLEAYANLLHGVNVTFFKSLDSLGLNVQIECAKRRE